MRKITLKHSLPARLGRHFTDELNDSQRTAVMAPDGSNLILAGPGSGKTRVITYRVAYLIARGVPADAILLVTFTRRAAREMVRRLDTLIGPEASKVWAGTFHHIGNRLLRRPAKLLGYQPNFTILDGEDQLDLIRLAMDDAGFPQKQKEKLAPKPSQLLHLISFGVNTRSPLASIVLTQRGTPGVAAADRGRGPCIREVQARGQLHGLRRSARSMAAADQGLSGPARSASRDVSAHPDR